MINRHKYMKRRAAAAIGRSFHRNISLSGLGLLLATVIFLSCNRSNRSGVDETSPRSEIIYATRFSIEKSPGYTTIRVIEPWQGATGVKQTYYLVRQDVADTSMLPENGVVVRVPIKSIVCMSATHVAMIAALRQEHTIAGISGTGLIYNKTVAEAVSGGSITEVGYEESLNREAVLRMKPDLLMAYGIGGESAGYLANLSELGITVMLNAEYLEVDPLGKAEWIKVFGALYCMETRADSLFRIAVDEYESVRQLVSSQTATRPKVLLGLPWKDAWYISPGNSYISRLIEDAGGEYLWHDSRSDISMPLSLENVYLRALEADYWINPGAAGSMGDIRLADHRLADLPVFVKGNVFNNNKVLTGTGANDYWERGCTNPGLILKDLASIFHPSVFPDDTLTFYHKMLW
jgi:iron complex transport system substrate-binding protein